MAAASRSRRRCSAPRRRDDEMEVHPSEQELVETYLRPRVVSGDKGSSVSGFVHEADVYSADPAELTRRFTPAVARSNGDEAWYFFSAVRGLKGGRRRRARTVGDGAGWWHSEAGARPVLGASGRILGHRQSFSFITKDDDGKRVRSGWLMVEFGVDDDEELVLSKVYFSPRGPVATKPKAATSSCHHKRKLGTADALPPPPRQRRHRAAPARTDPDDGEAESSSHPIAENEPAAAPAPAPRQEADDADRGSTAWWLRTVFGITTTVTEADCIELNPWLKDILMPSPPRSPPPRSPSPRREPIDMPEIREFFTRGPYRGSPPPRPYYDPPLMAPVDDDKQQQLANQDADYSHVPRHDWLTPRLQFDLLYRAV